MASPPPVTPLVIVPFIKDNLIREIFCENSGFVLLELVVGSGEQDNTKEKLRGCFCFFPFKEIYLKVVICGNFCAVYVLLRN